MPQVAVAGGIDLEQDLAIHQQGEKLDPGKAILPAEPSDLLRRGQHGEGGRNLRIADPEQRAGARRFQHHLVAAPPQVGEARQDENVGIAERRRSRPIVGNLRLDDDHVRVARSPDAVLQQTMPGQSPDQWIDLLVDGPAAGSQRGERQTRAQLLRTLRRAGAERSEVDRIAIEVSEEFPSARASSVTWALSRAETVRGPARRPRFAAGARKVTLRYEGELD